MKKKFILNGTFKTIHNDDDDSLTISGYASTKDIDRDGDVILPQAWNESGGLDAFKNNPIILFNHNRNKPIGKATEVGIDTKGLKITAEITKAAGNIFDIIKSGILQTFSVGFQIKDAEFREETMGFLITDAELFEVSVVSVPANQAATFSVSKSFEDEKEFKVFKKQFTQESVDLADQLLAGKEPASSTSQVISEKIIMEKSMDEEQLTKLAAQMAADISKATAEAVAKGRADDKAAIAAEAVEAAKAKTLAEKEETNTRAIISASISGAEQLIKDMEERHIEKQESLETIVAELKTDIAQKAEEMVKIHASKRIFDDRGQNKEWSKEFSKSIDDAFILGLATKKPWQETKMGEELVKAVNTWSGVQVSSADYEQLVSTNIERDIQLELVLAPLFREVEMNSATMIFPILPDAGYAEFTGNQTATGSSPHGNLAERGDTYGSAFGGVDLTERSITAKKLISQSYLANETEEDSIMPVLPLIRESMIRSHARGIEQMILAGNSVDGIYGTSNASPDGLISLADDANNESNDGATGFTAGDTILASDLLEVRRNMGKYAVKPEDMIYVVSLDVYYDLLEDAEFQDVNLVGGLATKVTGQVGTIFGSKVIISDEFATKALAKTAFIGVNTRNFFIPRLRGFTVETDNEVANQRRVIVMSQRIGFTDIIPVTAAAASTWRFQYKLDT